MSKDPRRGSGFVGLSWATAWCFILAAPANAHAFERMKTQSGAPLAWVSMPIAYDVSFALGDSEGEARSAAARSAFDRWSFAPSSAASAVYRGPGAQRRDDHGVTVVFDNQWDSDRFGERDRTIGFTEIIYDVRTGSISDADIHLNADRFRFASDGTPATFDSESAVLHEAGHVFGLDHTQIVDAVMAPGLAPNVTRRSLTPDDLAGIAAVYPGARAAPMFALRSIERPCPGDDVVVRGDALEGRAFELRYADGSTRALDVRAIEGGVAFDAALIDDGRGAVDLIARDATSGASAIDFVAELPSCLDPGEEGCDCRTASRTASMRATFFMLCALRLARRRR